MRRILCRKPVVIAGYVSRQLEVVKSQAGEEATLNTTIIRRRDVVDATAPRIEMYCECVSTRSPPPGVREKMGLSSVVDSSAIMFFAIAARTTQNLGVF